MPIKSTISDGIIYTEISGEINYDLVVKQIDFILSLKDKLVNRYELHDHTDTNLINISSDDIQKMAVASKTTRDIFKHSFLAVYAPTDYTFGIARMFMTFFELSEHTINVKIFRNKEEAIQFLKDCKHRYG